MISFANINAESTLIPDMQKEAITLKRTNYRLVALWWKLLCGLYNGPIIICTSTTQLEKGKIDTGIDPTNGIFEQGKLNFRCGIMTTSLFIELFRIGADILLYLLMLCGNRVMFS